MKRILAILMTVVLLVAMSSAIFAAVPAPIKDIDVKNFQTRLTENGSNSLILFDGKKLAANRLSELTPAGGSVLKIYLTTNMFVDKDGKSLTSYAGSTNTHVSKAELRAGKITVKRSNSQGKKVISTFGIKYDKKGAYLNIEFADPYVSIKETDFSGTYYLYVNGKRREETRMVIGGTMANKVVEAYSDTDYINISGGEVVEAQERVSKVEIDIGHDVTITTSLAKDKKYYGICTDEESDDDLAVVEKYPDIVSVYTLHLVNLASTRKVVSITTDDKLYVYGAEGEYLGTTNSKTLLLLSEKYYLSETKYDALDLSL